MTFDVGIIIDASGVTLPTGPAGDIVVDFNATITKVTMLSGLTGYALVDIMKTTYAQYDGGSTHPVWPGDSITANDKPTLVNANKYSDSALTGWTTTINAGDILSFFLPTGTTGVTRALVELACTRR
jgi:hypothetical protein